MIFVQNREPIIQANETTLKVNRDGRKAGSSSYMWSYITGEYDASGKRLFCMITAETVKANNLKPYQYFEYLLTELPERVFQKKYSTFSLEDLMPWSLKLPMTCRKIK